MLKRCVKTKGTYCMWCYIIIVQHHDAAAADDD